MAEVQVEFVLTWISTPKSQS